MLEDGHVRRGDKFFFFGGGHSSAQPSIIYLILLLQYISCLHRAHPPQWPPWWCKKNLGQNLRLADKQKDKQTNRQTDMQGQMLSCVPQLKMLFKRVTIQLVRGMKWNCSPWAIKPIWIWKIWAYKSSCYIAGMWPVAWPHQQWLEIVLGNNKTLWLTYHITQ